MPVLRFLTSLFALVALVALVADATPALSDRAAKNRKMYRIEFVFIEFSP